MKRSEMVSEINQVFKELFPMDNYEDVADAILLLIENRGMLPPEIMTPVIKNESFYNKEDSDAYNHITAVDYYRGEIPYKVYVNEWEPEDE